MLIRVVSRSYDFVSMYRDEVFLLYEENCFGFLNAVAAFGSHNALSIEGGYYVRSLQPQSGREEVAESLG